jgi:hypothetical protein
VDASWSALWRFHTCQPVYRGFSRIVATDSTVQTTPPQATDDSLRQRLALAHERINQLRTENQQLRDALAHAHGELRGTRLNVERT